MELIGEFRSFAEWEAWRAANKPALDELRQIDIEQVVTRDGIDSPVFGKVPGPLVSVRSKNYRESIVVRQLNSRQRALIEILARQKEIWYNLDSAIYAAEAVTPFALLMRGRFSKFLGSEYTTNPAQKSKLFPIPIEDLMALSFPKASFDCAITNDVMEHVPSISLTLKELRRVMKPGGLLLSTFPFTNRPDAICKAELVKGKVVHHMPPEYHGNPVDPQGSLVFTIPGWDILDMVRDAGFRDAVMIKFASVPKGIWGGDSPFIDVLQAVA